MTQGDIQFALNQEIKSLKKRLEGIDKRCQVACGTSEPSEGHDWVDEVIGLLRVARSKQTITEFICQGYVRGARANQDAATLQAIRAGQVSKVTPIEQVRYTWVPEALPKFPGTYAKTPQNGINCTMNIHEALQFDTEEECKKWCETHSYPKFVPVQHGIG